MWHPPFSKGVHENPSARLRQAGCECGLALEALGYNSTGYNSAGYNSAGYNYKDVFASDVDEKVRLVIKKNFPGLKNGKTFNMIATERFVRLLSPCGLMARTTALSKCSSGAHLPQTAFDHMPMGPCAQDSEDHLAPLSVHASSPNFACHTSAAE